ncbi:hypothetical protein Ade02nite_61330 [Paractinoplanes deccanensis]|uniref:Uncharacterized protein n=1 Tax=Paractinoplanes deccanensis TaxID=113561 RepID=A0ABQ3YBU7_9ACTN|nr:hypothetical protein [Actinoplanes deccanensis]GID77492.1 hypothetical protein Ade02nite_61330 [Actinoplanes deccanensis]
MVLPFLATYPRDDQQGLYILGGTAADRTDPRTLIALGCGLRVVSFGLPATVTSPPGS